MCHPHHTNFAADRQMAGLVISARPYQPEAPARGGVERPCDISPKRQRGTGGRMAPISLGGASGCYESSRPGQSPRPRCGARRKFKPHPRQPRRTRDPLTIHVQIEPLPPIREMIGDLALGLSQTIVTS